MKLVMVVHSDAECDGYKCVVSFKDTMKEVELEHLCFDASEIEGRVEVVNNDAFMCEVTDDIVQSGLYGAPPGWSAPYAPMIGVQRSIQIKESNSLKIWIILEVEAHILSD